LKEKLGEEADKKGKQQQVWRQADKKGEEA
jgi:hypothetical protein